MRNLSKCLLAAVISSSLVGGALAQTPIDRNLLNEEQVVAFLKRTGALPQDATPEQIKLR
ncbi:hypothetical protein [Veronia nyctiphanis]|uniref:hypothetical protein n=1 Tax=Veronia nyctiphanis TaxID=1278244 RepID=UPI0038B56238